MEQLGLINFLDVGDYSRPIPNKDFPYIHIVCDDHVMTAINTINNFPTGTILLTKAGRCISRFAPARYNQQHMEAIKYYLEKDSTLKFSLTPGIRITGIKVTEKGMEYSYERLSITPPQKPEQQ